MEIKDVAYFVTDKVPCSCLSNTNYIGVDNIKPNKQGIIPSQSMDLLQNLRKTIFLLATFALI